jgi:hypothetical protein
MITLKNLHEATKQEVFNQAVRHLLTQGQRALDAFDNCCYRTDSGLKCGAGCLIADDEYKPEFEGDDWMKLVDNGDVSRIHVGLMCRLQNIHDNNPVARWRDELEALADKYRLNTEVLTTKGEVKWNY